MFSLGINISQDTFDVCFYDGLQNKDISASKFTNNPEGFDSLKAELSRKSVLFPELNAYLESTGGLEENLFVYLKKTSVNSYSICYEKQQKCHCENSIGICGNLSLR